MKKFKFMSNDNFIPLVLLIMCIIGLFLITTFNKYGEVINPMTKETIVIVLTVACLVALIPLVYYFFKEDKKSKNYKYK